MSNLLPWLSRKRTKVVKLELIVDKQAIPELPGAYVMLSEDIEYRYPRGESRVFYIGCAADLRRRIWNEHRKYIIEARDNPQYDYYLRLYEYAASKGCKITWMKCRSTQSEKPEKRLEKKLLIDFAKYYGAIPVANGQGAW